MFQIQITFDDKGEDKRLLVHPTGPQRGQPVLFETRRDAERQLAQASALAYGAELVLVM